MSQSIAGDLDIILQKLIDDPKQLDDVKRTLEGKIAAMNQKPDTLSYARFAEDDDDMFDNMPV